MLHPGNTSCSAVLSVIDCLALPAHAADEVRLLDRKVFEDAKVLTERQFLMDKAKPERHGRPGRVIESPSSFPRSSMRPSSGLTSPPTIFISVLLPAPLPPISATTSEPRTSRSMSCTARVVPKDLWMPCHMQKAGFGSRLPRLNDHLCSTNRASEREVAMRHATEIRALARQLVGTRENARYLLEGEGLHRHLLAGCACSYLGSRCWSEPMAHTSPSAHCHRRAEYAPCRRWPKPPIAGSAFRPVAL